MTITDSDLVLPMNSDGDGSTIISRIVDIDGIPMSALLAEAAAPRAVIVAVHGGATSSAYFDCPGHPRLSLLRTAPALGFTVIAIDRPGYGTSAPYGAELGPPARRINLAYATVDQILGSRPRGAGIFVLAHSAGCELAVRMAADERGADLLGIELAGTGLQHQPAAGHILTAPQRGEPVIGVRDLLWQPSRLYPPELFGGAAISSSGPAYEATVVRNWAAQDFPALAPHVRVPVQFTAAEHEKVWRNDALALGEIAAMFTGSPRVVLNQQADSGHNLSLGHTATAYHLTVMSFVEECAVVRENGGFTSVASEFDPEAQ